MSLPIDPRWYAVLTAPRCEETADWHLRRQGMLTFYPHHRDKVRFGVRRQLREVNRPYFPRYLFVGLRGEAIGTVNDTIGVSTVVYLGGNPLEIPGEVMDELFERVDGEGVIARPEPPHWFRGKVGDMVVLKDEAPYFGLMAQIATVADLDGRDAIGVWLDLLGSRRKVSIPARAVAEIVR